MARHRSKDTGKPAARRAARRRVYLLLLGTTVALAGAFAVGCLDANWRFARHAPPPPVRIYSAPFALAEGKVISVDDLAERLARLGYRQVEGAPRVPGEYARRFRTWTIALNRSEGPEGTVDPGTVKVRLSSGRIAGVESAGKGQPTEPRLEAEPLGVLAGDVREERIPVTLAELPIELPHAVIAIEDRRFATHPGVDPIGIVRALWANMRHGEVVQGGSTITQQLAKNLYGGQEDRTLARKLWETLAAVSLEMTRGKDAILERYLNEIYLAQRGPYAIVGVGAASRHYFGKEARYLDLPESALLAGLIQSPGRYQPYRHPREARERRDLVLKAMREEGFIDEARYQAALAVPLNLRPEPPHEPRLAPYFLDYVAEELNRTGLLEGKGAGLRVYTTLDPLLQERAEAAVAKRLVQYERGDRRLRPMPGGPLQGAVVALRPADGAILAMVGGRDYGESQFNRITQARRQPGSLFKPFVYLAGFTSAQDAGDSRFTAATVFDDAPLEMVVSGKPWAPQNFDREFRGPVTARMALSQSLNVPTIRAAEAVGLKEVVRTARRAGIESPLEPVPSLALGTFEVTPLEIAAAFTSFANLGRRAVPRAIAAVIDANGKPVAVPPPDLAHAASEQATYLTVDLMRDVVRSGTAAGLQDWHIDADIAGKTGTTDDGRDAWFVGFTPDFLALAWVGFDNNRALHLGGATLAMPIWADLAAAADLDAKHAWEEPEGLVRADIDPTTGRLAGWRCPASTEEIFIAGTEPTEPCEHDHPFESWAHRWFHWFRRD
jgi:1A family penicillin-binding protein